MSTRPTAGFLGWPRRGWVILGTWAGGVLLVSGLTLALHGLGDEAFGAVARSAARSSLLAFALAFGASPLHLFFPGAATRWLVEQRPYLGVSFVFSHFVFLATNVTRVFVHYDGQPFALRPPVAWIAGGAVYLLILGMAITSFPGPARAIGRRSWRALHLIGGYAVLLGFVNSYLTRALEMPRYVPMALVVVALLGLRVAAFLKRNAGPCQALLEACRRRCTGNPA